jgi:hypothetical protein
MGKIAINPDRFDKLITSLRTAVDNDGVLDKKHVIQYLHKMSNFQWLL